MLNRPVLVGAMAAKGPLPTLSGRLGGPENTATK